VFTAGATSARVAELLSQQQIQLLPHMRPIREFDDLFILDRTLDLVTPLFPQHTYGAMIDEVMGMTGGYIRVGDNDEVDLFSPADEIFPRVRALHYGEVMAGMVEQLRETQEVIGGLRDLVGSREWNAKALRAVELRRQQPTVRQHLTIIESIARLLPPFYIQTGNKMVGLLHGDPIDVDVAFTLMTAGHFARGISLLCAKSILDGGLGKPYEELLARMIAEWGLPGVADFAALERVGLITEAKFFGGKAKFLAAVEKLRIVIDGGDDADLGAVYAMGESWGYVPILVRLVQEGLIGEWREGGRTAKTFEQLDVKFSVVGEEAPVAQTVDGAVVKKVLVFVIGGVTEQEALVFQQLGRVAFDDKVEVHLASTNVITGSRLVMEVCPSIPK
jgi:hypothetical protein